MSTIHRDDDKMDAFKREFKRYKQRKPTPDLSEVIDFTQPETQPFRKWVFPSKIQGCDSKQSSQSGLKPCSQWNIYEVRDHPGFIFIVNPFIQGSQRYWIEKCIKVFPCKPNMCNLDAHMDRVDKNYIWEQTTSSESCLEKSLLYKLRWVTLGYHYDWESKTYSKGKHSEFPADLSELLHFIASSLQFPSFKSEAGIINYYHLGSTLSGHTDHSELDLTAPLFSLSFGQSAIFLLGGETREETPVAMCLRSGDIMVMAGKSRLAYHAVPRILAPIQDASMLFSDLHNKHVTIEEGTTLGDKSNCACAALEEKRIIEQYVATSRININVRQVLGPGQDFPGDEG